jgi:lysyl-tRNA synthetase class I
MKYNFERELKRQFREQQKYRRLMKKYGKARPYKGLCEKCGKPTPDPLQRVDESNIAITYHNPYLCANCYEVTP